jgi:ubiquinone/menaquinone biosynthesis C-methylase UbiE
LAENGKDKVKFDDYAGSYRDEVQSSINFIGQDVDFFHELKAKKLIELAQKYFTDYKNIKILDIGCGIGLIDFRIKKEFQNLFGVDIEEQTVKKAEEKNPEVSYQVYDGLKLPFDDNTIDLAFAINVVHHVPSRHWGNFIKEMYRVLKPGGYAAIFEHNPYNPLTRLAVNRCEFDRDAELINRGKVKNYYIKAGFSIEASSYIAFFPFSQNFFRKIEKTIGWLPMGAQYFITSKKNEFT